MATLAGLFPGNIRVIRAVGYVRVSTELQAREGVSLDAQRERILAWCRGQGIAESGLAMHADEGISGKRADNRPGLARALDDACATPCALVVYSLSRVARSVRDTLAIAERLDAANADLVSLTENIDTTTAAGKMLFRLLAVLAEFERDLISERTRGGIAHKRGRGERVGSVPRGKAVAGDGKTLVDDAAELLDLDRIRRLALDGHGARAIARLMAVGDRRWPESTVRRILKRPAP